MYIFIYNDTTKNSFTQMSEPKFTPIDDFNRFVPCPQSILLAVVIITFMYAVLYVGIKANFISKKYRFMCGPFSSSNKQSFAQHPYSVWRP